MAPGPGHDNNFGALRLLFATLVLVSHSWPISTGNDDHEPLFRLTGFTTLGSVAVDGFFLISGCLITQSWLRSKNLGGFVVRRVLRIYPAYLVAFAFSFAVAFATSPQRTEYLKAIAYDNDGLLRAVLFFDYGILDQPAAFPDHPLPHRVNGSLWTLRSEVQCYLITLVLGSFGLAGSRRATVIIAVLSLAAAAVNFTFLGPHIHKFTRFTAMYFLGACVANGVLPVLPRPALVFVISFLACVLATVSRLTWVLVYPMAFAVCLFSLAHAKTTPGLTWFRRWDLSYGVFLFAFPVQQLIVREAHDPLIVMTLALPITYSLAAMSWKWIENPCIARSHQSA